MDNQYKSKYLKYKNKNNQNENQDGGKVLSEIYFVFYSKSELSINSNTHNLSLKLADYVVDEFGTKIENPEKYKFGEKMNSRLDKIQNILQSQINKLGEIFHTGFYIKNNHNLFEFFNHDPYIHKKLLHIKILKFMNKLPNDDQYRLIYNINKKYGRNKVIPDGQIIINDDVLKYLEQKVQPINDMKCEKSNCFDVNFSSCVNNFDKINTLKYTRNEAIQVLNKIRKYTGIPYDSYFVCDVGLIDIKFLYGEQIEGYSEVVKNPHEVKLNFLKLNDFDDDIEQPAKNINTNAIVPNLNISNMKNPLMSPAQLTPPTKLITDNIPPTDTITNYIPPTKAPQTTPR